MTQAEEMARAAGLELRREDCGLVLAGDGMELCADFAAMLPRIRPDRLSGELLVKVARIKGEPVARVFDATAGLGEDSFLLAAAGFDVVLCEANPVIAALLEDALARAALDDRLAPIVARMHLRQVDSVAELGRMAQSAEPHPDVVYLDPMFPARQKSAAVKKKFQLIHHLEAPCQNEGALLAAAISACPRKVVVKRPAKGPHLAGVKPSHSLAGKAVRYDVIIPASIKVPLA